MKKKQKKQKNICKSGDLYSSRKDRESCLIRPEQGSTESAVEGREMLGGVEPTIQRLKNSRYQVEVCKTCEGWGVVERLNEKRQMEFTTCPDCLGDRVFATRRITQMDKVSLKGLAAFHKMPYQN